MMRVNGQEIVTTEVEYGVHFTGVTGGEEIYQADDREDAEFIATFTSGDLIARTWCATGWTKVNA